MDNIENRFIDADGYVSPDKLDLWADKIQDDIYNVETMVVDLRTEFQERLKALENNRNATDTQNFQLPKDLVFDVWEILRCLQLMLSSMYTNNNTTVYTLRQLHIMIDDMQAILNKLKPYTEGEDQ